MCQAGILAVLAHSEMSASEIADRLSEEGYELKTWGDLNPEIYVAMRAEKAKQDKLVERSSRVRGDFGVWNRYRITEKGRQELQRIQVVWMKNHEATERALRGAFRESQG